MRAHRPGWLLPIAAISAICGLAGGALALWVPMILPTTPAQDGLQQQSDGTQSPPATQPAERESELLTGARARLQSGLVGSKHDFRRGCNDCRDLCFPCHVPHVRDVPAPRLDDRPPTTQPLRPYQSLDAELDGWSLLCLGCHDGVTAPDVYSSSHAVATASQLGNSWIGARGLRSHPVGILYPTNSEDYNPPVAVEAAGLLLPNGRIQCGTCHDAHNTMGYEGMLKISNERSQVCLTCHRR